MSEFNAKWVMGMETLHMLPRGSKRVSRPASFQRCAWREPRQHFQSMHRQRIAPRKEGNLRVCVLL